MRSSLYQYHTSQILDASYPYEALDASYPYKAAVRSKRSARQIAAAALIGMFPLLVMLALTALTLVTMSTNRVLACNVYMQDAIYSFVYTSPVVPLIAIPFLFLKGKRKISLALPIWVLSLAYAFLIFMMLAFASDGCSGITLR